MRVLVTYGSKRGGTEGLARMVGAALGEAGIEATVEPPEEVEDVASYQAVIVGGALYNNRWQRDARRFVKRHTKTLLALPVWFFSSGPLDGSAAAADIPPTKQVQRLMHRINARGHVTFGGRLTPDAKGFLARQMARTRAGDFRDPAHVRRWVAGLVAALAPSRPR